MAAILPSITPVPPPPPLSAINLNTKKTSLSVKQPLLKLGGSINNRPVDRAALLKSIQGGVKLRKTITIDKSGLILDDEQREIALLKSRPDSANSIDSQE